MICLQGICGHAPGPPFAAAALGLGPDADEAWQAPRCVVVTDDDLFIVDRSRLWVDSLHIQIVNRDPFSNPVPLWTAYIGQTFVSNVVVQGNGKDDEDSQGTCVDVQESAAGIFARGADPRAHDQALSSPISCCLSSGMRNIYHSETSRNMQRNSTRAALIYRNIDPGACLENQCWAVGPDLIEQFVFSGGTL